MKLLIVIVLILAVLAIAQMVRVYELASALRNKKEEDVTLRDNKLNATLMLVFMFAYFALLIGLMVRYGNGGLGKAASLHGAEVDALYTFNWAIIMPAFFLTHILLFGFAYKYYHRPNRKALFYPHNNKLELIWTVVPAVVLAVIIIWGLTVWNNITDKSPQEATVIELYAKQFDWTARYAGEDNMLGKSDYKLISSTNPLGIVTRNVIEDKTAEFEADIAKLEKEIHDNKEFMNADDLSEKQEKIKRLNRHILKLKPLYEAQNDTLDMMAEDDIVTRELVLIKNHPYEFRFRSRDVIHSAYFPHFRAQMNCVPGTVTRFKFVPTISTKEMRMDEDVIAKYKRINKKRAALGKEPADFNFLLLCNKICGTSHFNMQMNITVVDSQEEYDAFMKEQKTFKASLASN